MIAPRRHRRTGISWPLLAGVVLIVFARLVADPAALIVDGDHASIDRATPPDAVAVGNDLTRLFLPHHARISQQVAKTGRVPGWDPAGFGGRPLVGNPQAGLWYPPVWLAWRWWSPSSLGWLTLAHLAFGGIGVEVLARSQHLSRGAALVAGAIWITSPYVLGQTYEGHYPHVWSASYVPWTFWAGIGAIQGHRRGWLLPGLLALGALTGHSQETFYLTVALFVWAIFEAARTRRWRRLLSGMALIGILTTGMLAVEILPDLAMRPHVVAPFRPTAVDASRYHVGIANIAQLFCPKALGGPSDYRGEDNYWESLLSFGLLPTVLAVVGAWRYRRRMAVRGWVALVVLSVLFAFGRYFVVFDIAYLVTPGMTSFRVPSRSLFLASVGVAVLAGYGVHAVSRVRTHHRGAVIRGGIVGIGCVLLGMACLAMVLPEPSRAILATMSDPRFVGALVALLLAVAGLVAQPRRRILIAGFLGVAAIAEMTAYGFDLIRVAPASRFLGPDPVGRAVLAASPDVPFRVRTRDAFYGDARAFALGLEKTNLNDSFQIRRAADLYERLYPMFGSPQPTRFPERFRPEVQAAVLQRMNVGLTISDRDTPDIGWPLVCQGKWQGATFTIRRNPDLLPRAYVVPRVELVKDGPAVVDRFVACDPRKAVLMDHDPLEGRSRRQAFLPATYDASDPDRVEVRVTTEAPGLLVVADTWMPGWSATDRGRPVPILRGNRSQRVVPLKTPGEHRVVMTYDPPWFRAGLVITLWSLGIWLGAIVWTLRSERG